MSLARTFHTVRHLRQVQVVDRVRRRLRPLDSIPIVEGGARLLKRAAVLPARRPDSFDGRSFRFLNVSLPHGGLDRWAPGAASRLWTYNLHYFEYLWAVPGDAAPGLMQDWVDANRDAASPGWEPYPLSLRIREWIEWLHDHRDLPAAPRDCLSRSLASQAEALARQVEWHLLGNHMVENAVTLAWAGLSFEGARADRWLRQGLRLLRAELGPQILDDDAHDERSPMYQALLAHGLLRLAEVARQSSVPGAVEVDRVAADAGGRLLAGLEPFVHPDGGYALVNDCAFGVAPTLAQLRSRFPGAAPTARPAGAVRGGSGYCAGRRGPFYLLFDAGPIGPDHQPGHGHADNLSFELSLHGRRVVTDTGVGSYETGPARRHDRSTAAHNTVELDGRNQSDVWAAFRCGRRAVSGPAVSRDVPSGVFDAEGSYRSDFGRGAGVEHRRSVSLSDSELRVNDELVASGEHTARVRLHFAPGLELEARGGGWDVLDGGRRLASVLSYGLQWKRGASPYHPEFGVEIERQCLVADVRFRDRASTSFAIAAD